MRKVAGRLKIELSQYRDLEAFAQFGSDLDPETQRTLARGERLVKTLNQGERQPMAVEDQVAVIYAATNGYVDRIDADKVPDFGAKLVDRLHAAIAEVMDRIADGDWSDETQKSLDDAIGEFARDYGYDLDEEGHPLTDEAAIREGSGRPAERREDEAQEGGEAAEEQPEAVGAGS
jgi:F-type H+-transporting ATPase subunit alpha